MTSKRVYKSLIGRILREVTETVDPPQQVAALRELSDRASALAAASEAVDQLETRVKDELRRHGS